MLWCAESYGPGVSRVSRRAVVDSSCKQCFPFLLRHRTSVVPCTFDSGTVIHFTLCSAVCRQRTQKNENGKILKKCKTRTSVILLERSCLSAAPPSCSASLLPLQDCDDEVFSRHECHSPTWAATGACGGTYDLRRSLPGRRPVPRGQLRCSRRRKPGAMHRG